MQNFSDKGLFVTVLCSGNGLNVQCERKGPTISLVNEGTLRRVWDALPDGDGFRIPRVHTPDILIVPPVPEPKSEDSQW